MNNKVNKQEMLQKDIFEERRKDRGDALRNKLNDAVQLRTSKTLPNQGDGIVNNKFSKIPRLVNVNKVDKVTNERDKKQNDSIPKLTIDASKIDTVVEKKSINRASENIATANKSKVVNDKLNLRPRVPNLVKDIKNVVKFDLKTEHTKNQENLESAPKSVPDSNKSDSTKASGEVKKDKEVTNLRKPLIKTVKSKNDDKVYKAVTFTEEKKIKPTLLEINIPNLQAKKKSNQVDKNLEAKPASLQGSNDKSLAKQNIRNIQIARRTRLAERVKPKKLNRCISSPDKFKKAESPPTEVAKWAPSCLNPHTKPYYEAWVDTTLTAISKISKKDKLYYEKQNIIKTFQRSLELGTQSPELVHENMKDECYTGKIKIKQKNLAPKKTRQPLITPLISLDSDKEK